MKYFYYFYQFLLFNLEKEECPALTMANHLFYQTLVRLENKKNNISQFFYLRNGLNKQRQKKYKIE